MTEPPENPAAGRTSIADALTALRQPSFLRVMLVLAATVVVLAGVSLAAPILNPILFAVVLTLLFSSVYSWLMRRGLPAPVALLAILTILFGALFFILGVSISSFGERVGFYTTELNGQLDSLDTLLERSGLSNIDVRDAVNSGALAGALGTVLAGIAGFLSDLFLILMIMLFLLGEGPAMMNRLRASETEGNQQVARLTAVGENAKPPVNPLRFTRA